MNNPQKEPEGLPPFLPNWVLGSSFLTIVAVVGLGVYCQTSSAENQKETTQEQVAEILAQPIKIINSQQLSFRIVQ